MTTEMKVELIESLFRLRSLMGANLLAGDGDDSVNLSECVVLLKAYKNDAPGYSVYDDVKNTLYVSKAAVSQMLKSLEKKGLVTRDIPENDRRTVIVRVTEAGKKILERKKRLFEEFFDKIFDTLGSEKVAELTGLLNKMCAGIEKSS